MTNLPEYQVLDFGYGHENNCGLTALIHGAWYTVFYEPVKQHDRSKKGKQLAGKYWRLINQVRAAEQRDAHETEPLFVQPDENVSPEMERDRDSAVDVSTPEEEADQDEDPKIEPTTALEQWMLNPLAGVFERRKQDTTNGRTVQEFYHCPKYFFRIVTKEDEMRAEEIKPPSSAMQQRVQYLIPSMPVPKYIRDLEIPSISAADLTILRESMEPAPVHPARVRYEGKEYFLKVVDPKQYQPTRREIQVMTRIESEGLDKELRVPLLRGLVHFSNGPRRYMMGFIMDAIDDPTPLTLLIDSDVEEEKRMKWSTESARMVDVLHQHSIIWGDAKGDNFMVDAHDELWIIDFGGSYTEGWVDPDLKETEEGDNMGVKKICNGLEDPDKNTFQPGEFEEEESSIQQHEEGPGEDTKQTAEAKSTSRKRRVDEVNDVDEGDQPSRKQRRSNTNIEDERPLYCYCNKPSAGNMLGCDGENCRREWFHFACLGIEEEPYAENWYCDECKEETKLER